MENTMYKLSKKEISDWKEQGFQGGLNRGSEESVGRDLPLLCSLVCSPSVETCLLCKVSKVGDFLTV